MVILSAPAHESTVRPAVEKYGLNLGIGIDRFVPKSEYTISNATMIQYGFGKMPMLFVIDSDGTIRHFQSGLDGIDKVLGQ